LHWLKDTTEWNGTSVVWDLSSHGGKTTLTMTHRGLVPGIECYETCEKGWNFYLEKSLFKFLADGEGLPERAEKKPQTV
jgi:hypothetical protein